MYTLKFSVRGGFLYTITKKLGNSVTVNLSNMKELRRCSPKKVLVAFYGWYSQEKIAR